MFIQTEDTPNSETLKFLPGRVVINNGTRQYNNRNECINAPLARRLFDIDGVSAVMYGFDFVSVTKNNVADWSFVKPLVLSSMMDHFVAGLTVLDEHDIDTNNDTENDSSIVKEIKQLLETRVRPSVAQDGGDILFDRFDTETGILYLHLRGACSGCPSSSMTLKSGIENMMRYYVPEVLEVRAVSEDS